MRREYSFYKEPISILKYFFGYFFEIVSYMLFIQSLLSCEDNSLLTVVGKVLDYQDLQIH